MLDMVMKNMRGGISVSNHSYAKSNNIYNNEEYIENEEK